MKKGKVLVTVLTALSLGNSFFIPTDDIHFIWEKFPLSSALIGLIGCLLLVVITKIVIKHAIQRDESYYD
jgi:ABC-type microcin C transport system permease subunit YejB